MSLTTVTQDITDLFRTLRNPGHPVGAGDSPEYREFLARMRDASGDTITGPAAMRRPVGRVAADIVNRPAAAALHCRLLAARGRRRTRLWLRRTYLVDLTTAKEAL